MIFMFTCVADRGKRNNFWPLTFENITNYFCDKIC